MNKTDILVMLLHPDRWASEVEFYARCILQSDNADLHRAVCAYGAAVVSGAPVSREVTVQFFRAVYSASLPGYRDLTGLLKPYPERLSSFEDEIARRVYLDETPCADYPDWLATVERDCDCHICGQAFAEDEMCPECGLCATCCNCEQPLAADAGDDDPDAAYYDQADREYEERREVRGRLW